MLIECDDAMVAWQHEIVLSAEAGSSRHGYTKVTDDLRRGKVTTEQYIPIAKQVTKNYQTGEVNTTELMKKETTTKDYRKGTMTKKECTTAKTVTEDRRKGIKTTEKLKATKTVTKDCRTIRRAATKQSHHSSKEICPMSMFTRKYFMQNLFFK